MDKWRKFSAAVTCAAVLALAGCTPGREPVVTDSPSGGVSVTSSTTPTPSASPSALTTAELLVLMPPGADSPDVQGAVVTAEFFLEQYAPMFQSGDASVWDALSGPDCAFCASASKSAGEFADANAVVSGGEIDVDPNSINGVQESDSVVLVRLVATQSEGAVTLPGSTPTVGVVTNRSTYAFQMNWNGDLWVVHEVEVAEPE